MIALGIDRQGWAFDRIARQIAARVPGCEIVANAPIDYASTTCLVAVYWGTPHWHGCHGKRFLCVYDHISWRKHRAEFELRVRAADRVFCSSELLRDDLFSELLLVAEVLTDGVDLDMFAPSPLPADFRAAWVGNSRLYDGIKGLDLVIEACQRAEVELTQANPADDQRVAYVDMPGFYRRASVLVCASESEGTPNPVLEACASGRPVISTRVGVVPMLRSPGVRIVDRAAEDIADALVELATMPREDLVAMGTANRSAVSAWTWSDRLAPLVRALGPFASSMPITYFGDLGLPSATSEIAVVADWSRVEEAQAYPHIVAYVDHVPTTRAERVVLYKLLGAADGVLCEDRELARLVPEVMPRFIAPRGFDITRPSALQGDVVTPETLEDAIVAAAHGQVPVYPGFADVPPPDRRLPLVRAAMRRRAEQFSWEARLPAFHRAIRQIARIRDTRVVLVHCGEATTDRVRRALEASDGYGTEWDVAEVEGVSPMDAAFNAMLDAADLEFHVQVDADMELAPDTIQTMRTCMDVAPEDVWQIAFPLWDTLFERPIYGVKIYRSAVARRYRYRAVRHCETDQYDRARIDGYSVDIRPMGALEEHCVGRHLVEDAKTAFWNCYDRSARMQRRIDKGEFNWFSWMEPYFRAFPDRYAETGDRRFLAAWAGLIAGLEVELPEDWGEKDATKPPRSWARVEGLCL